MGSCNASYDLIMEESKEPESKEELQTSDDDSNPNVKLQNYIDNPNVGVNWETLIAFANGHEFKVNPKGHIKSNKDEIRKIQKDYTQKMTTSEIKRDVLSKSDLYEEISEKLAKLCLVDFDYNVWANHEDLGPTVIGQMITEVSTFLVVQGGKAGYKHWQMQHQFAMLTQLNLSSTSKDSQNNS